MTDLYGDVWPVEVLERRHGRQVARVAEVTARVQDLRGHAISNVLCGAQPATVRRDVS